MSLAYSVYAATYGASISLHSSNVRTPSELASIAFRNRAHSSSVKFTPILVMPCFISLIVKTPSLGSVSNSSNDTYGSEYPNSANLKITGSKGFLFFISSSC